MHCQNKKISKTTGDFGECNIAAKSNLFKNQKILMNTYKYLQTTSNNYTKTSSRRRDTYKRNVNNYILYLEQIM